MRLKKNHATKILYPPPGISNGLPLSTVLKYIKAPLLTNLSSDGSSGIWQVH
jgi:hypothetical protein